MRPNGREFAAHNGTLVTDYEWTALRDTHASSGILIDAKTAATRWRGERMDYHLGVSLLCERAARAQRTHAAPEAQAQVETAADPAENVSAETFCESDVGWVSDAEWLAEWRANWANPTS